MNIPGFLLFKGKVFKKKHKTLNKKYLIMKKNNIYVIGMGVIFLMFSSVRPAAAAEEVENKAKGEPVVIPVELTNPASINVIVYDNADRVVYKDSIPAGSTFEDAVDFSSFIRILNVEDSGIVLSESYYSFTPQFEQEEKLLRVNFINSPRYVILHGQGTAHVLSQTLLHIP
jgi:hypothetical protein